MKYLNTVLLFLALSFFCFACTAPNREKKKSELENWLQDNGKIKVLATTSIVADLVSVIGKERIDLITLIYGEVDPHTYELLKGDGEKLQYAELIFASGLGLEHGASLQRHLQLHSNTVFLGNEIQKNYPELIITKDKQIDPHLWMDVSLWSKGIDSIVAALSFLDPASKEQFEKNAVVARALFEKIDQEILAKMQSIPEKKRFLVTSHDAFNYFTKRYLATLQETETNTWEKRCIAPEGLAPEGQLSVADIQAVIRQIKEYDIHMLFPESNVGKDSLKKIVYACREKGMDVAMSSESLYADAMGPQSGPAGTYLGMMQHDAIVILNGWTGSNE